MLMMVEEFGDEYWAYQARTGRFLRRIWFRSAQQGSGPEGRVG